MDVKKFLRIQNAEEKVKDFKEKKKELEQLNVLGQELAEKFDFQKSIIEGVDCLPEEKRTEVFNNYRSFLKKHQKDVSDAMNRRDKLLKSLSRYRQDSEVGQMCRNIDALDNAKKAYLLGNLKKEAFFSIQKSITGEPVKYADVVAFNKDGKLLILHRTEDFVPTGKVCIPGGHVDPGEDFETAALRELKEETNLDPIKDKGIIYLGEFKNEDAHIKYFQVFVDDQQPVTVDASEHCFHEFIEVGEIPLKPFIFEQGENVLNMLMKPTDMDSVKPLFKALDEGRITAEIFSSGLTSILKKTIDTADAAPLMPEELDGCKKKLIIPVRDPLGCFEEVFKGISGKDCVSFGNEEVIFKQPITIHETKYSSDPSKNRLTEFTVIYSGDDSDISRVLNGIKMFGNLLSSKTPHEKFMEANEHKIDYVGEPVFVQL